MEGRVKGHDRGRSSISWTAVNQHPTLLNEEIGPNSQSESVDTLFSHQTEYLTESPALRVSGSGTRRESACQDPKRSSGAISGDNSPLITPPPTKKVRRQTRQFPNFHVTKFPPTTDSNNYSTKELLTNASHQLTATNEATGSSRHGIAQTTVESLGDSEHNQTFDVSQNGLRSTSANISPPSEEVIHSTINQSQTNSSSSPANTSMALQRNTLCVPREDMLIDSRCETCMSDLEVQQYSIQSGEPCLSDNMECFSAVENQRLQPDIGDEFPVDGLTDADLESLLVVDELDSGLETADNEHPPLQPFARPQFPTRMRDRSPIIGVTASHILRICFRIGEACKVASICTELGQNIIIELFARVISSHRVPDTFSQHFLFADLFHDRPPHPKGILENYQWSALQETEGRRLLGDEGVGKMVRCLGQLKKTTKDSDWMFHIANVRSTDWEEIQWTRSILELVEKDISLSTLSA